MSAKEVTHFQVSKELDGSILYGTTKQSSLSLCCASSLTAVCLIAAAELEQYLLTNQKRHAIVMTQRY